MSLSNEVIARFVKAARVDEKKSTESTVYGTVVEYNGRKFVRLDGSDRLTPVSSTANANNDERVSITIKDHTAIITGNVSSPAARTGDVEDIGNQISAFEIVIADKVSTKEFDAQTARIDELRATDVTIKGTLDAANAEIEKLIAEDVKITGILSANKAEIDEVLAKKIDAEIVAAKYAEIGDLEALRVNVRDLDATFGDFEVLTAKDFEAVNGRIDNLDTSYANIDFANIGEAAIRKIFSDTGIIKDLIVGDSTITGELVGVTIKGDLIKGNTIVADKLVVKGSDGLYYKLNIEGGATTSEEVTTDDLQNGLSGSVIIAKSITAEKISVKDLVAFGATIAGFKIDNTAIRSLTKSSPMNATRGSYLGSDGQFAVGDATNFIRYHLDEATQLYILEVSANVITIGGTNVSDDIQSVRHVAANAQSGADAAQSTADTTASEVTAANLRIDKILGELSTLVRDSNGESLMTQTPDGWVFKTTSIENSVNSLSTDLNELNEELGSTSSTVDALNSAINDLQNTANYVRIRDYESEPCIELGESDNNLKLLITNTRIMFLDDAGAIPTYIDRTGVVTDNVNVKNTISQGNYRWILRANGHLSLMWSETET